MRLRDLLFEDDTADEINNDLMDIIMTYKQKNKSKIPMHDTDKEEGLLNILKKAGFDLSSEEAMNVLTKDRFNNIVKRAGQDEIEIKTSIPDSKPTKSQLDKSEEKIDKIAKKAAKKAVKSGEV